MFKTNNKLYENLSDSVFITNINGLDIPFDLSWKRIGINLSGGADSAILTYLLCNIIQENNLQTQVDVITYQRCWETRPWQGYISQQVYMWLLNKFPKIMRRRHTTYIPPEIEHGTIGPIINNRSGDQIIVGSFNKFAAWEYNLDAVFNATSKNPDNLREDRMKNRDADAVDGNITDLWYYKSDVDAVFAHPFRFVKKDWIVAQYHMFDILDLYNITRSCEGDINHHDVVKQAVPEFSKYTSGMKVPVCNQCWWCEERAWAESQVQDTIKEILTNEL